MRADRLTGEEKGYIESKDKGRKVREIGSFGYLQYC